MMNTRVSRRTHSAIVVDNRGSAHSMVRHLAASAIAGSRL